MNKLLIFIGTALLANTVFASENDYSIQFVNVSDQRAAQIFYDPNPATRCTGDCKSLDAQGGKLTIEAKSDTPNQAASFSIAFVFSTPAFDVCDDPTRIKKSTGIIYTVTPPENVNPGNIILAIPPSYEKSMPHYITIKCT